MVRIRLRSLAEERGLNMSQLSFRTETAMTSVRRYWYGTKNGLERGSPLRSVDLDVLERFARVLKVKTLELFEEVEEAPQGDPREASSI